MTSPFRVKGRFSRHRKHRNRRTANNGLTSVVRLDVLQLPHYRYSLTKTQPARTVAALLSRYYAPFDRRSVEMNDRAVDAQQLTLQTVDDLRLNDDGDPQSFFIANYQRGYRWSPLQVTQLLDDILEFADRRDPQPDEFYCLQPLVLKVSDRGDYEVVDGQQRLTTLLLILRHFNERLTEKYRLPLYMINYETRPDLTDFLNDPTRQKAESNADFFHLYQAVEAIEEWFGDKENRVDDIKSALLNRTKVIWFQLADSDNPVEAFTRLNVGKIPLTNDELIRALFLKRESADETEADDLQRQIANEWDQYEKSLAIR